jgi:hypothetical protein
MCARSFVSARGRRLLSSAILAVLGFAVLAVFAASPAHAQVNVETLRGSLVDGTPIASIDAAFTGRAGNTSGMDGGGSFKFLYGTGRHRLFGFGSLDYTRLNKKLLVSRRWAHARYEYLVAGPWSGEAFVQTQSDAIRRLALRQLVGVGPRLRFVEERGLTTAVGVATMLELERVRVADGASDDPREINHRMSSYLSVVWAVDERVSLNGVVYFQPKWSRPSDYRVLADGGVVFAVTKRLSAKILLGLRHDHDPPTGVRPTDAELKNALSLTL